MFDALSGVVDLDRSSTTSLYRQIYEQLRAAILAGKLPAGTKVPASRAMAADLQVARNTVVAALDQLTAEGYLDSRRGAGTVVSAGISADLTRAVQRRSRAGPREHRLSSSGNQLAAVTRTGTGGETTMPLLPGIPDFDSFPREIWARLLRRASRSLPPDAAAYGGTGGLPRLQKALCTHLREARGVRAEPEQIIVTSSAQAALDLLARALLDPGDAVWIEEPGYLGARAAFDGAGAVLHPVQVDHQGLDPAAGHGQPRLIYVTPSHQYPTGWLMPLARRLELLEVAERHNAYVIEDDYDSEFQFKGRPIAALQGLDAEARVLYLGTFSKILQPGIRVGYIVVPSPLARPLARIQRNTGQVVASAIQLALADFIEEGHLRAHIRRMCALYHERQSVLADALNRRCAGALHVETPAGGMQFIARLENGGDDRALVEAVTEQGVIARALSQFHLETPETRGLLLGFAGYPNEKLEQAAAGIEAALKA